MDNQVDLVQNPSYLNNATQGNSSVWRYIVGTFLILFIWLVLGSVATAVPLIMFIIFQGLDFFNVLAQIINDFSLLADILGHIPNFLLLIVGFVFFYFGIWLTVRLVHGRPLRSLVTGKNSVSWRRMGVGFGIWFGLLLVGTLVEYLVWPESFTLTFDAPVFIPFAILAILLIPIQTTAEELFFRGYLVQAGSLISRNWIFLSIWSGVLFALPHFFNPEVASNIVVVMLIFFVLGTFLAWISLKDGTIELAIGVHAANNMAALLLVTFPDSSLPSPAIFTTPEINPVGSLIATIISCLLFYLILFARRRSTSPKTEVEIELE